MWVVRSFIVQSFRGITGFREIFPKIFILKFEIYASGFESGGSATENL